MHPTLEINLPKFPTHAQISKNKWVKISGNTFYSGTHYIIRNKVFRVMHDYIDHYIPKDIIFTRIETEMIFKAPINYGTVRRTKTKGISWNPPKDDYVPNWDIDNLAWPWTKAIFDTIISNNIVPDDNIKYVIGNSYKYEECDSMDDRNINLKIKAYGMD
jgi:hypothetical protein